MTVSLWQDVSARDRRTYDVVVVGAGIAGSYTAHLLAARGKKVALVEARQVASGASGRNAGMILMGLAENYKTAIELYGRDTARLAWSLTIENRQRTAELALKYKVPFTSCGSYLLSCDAKESEELAASAELEREDGFLNEFFPHDPLGRGFRAALAHPDDAVTHPVLLTEAIAKHSGADLYTGSEVFGIDIDPLKGNILVRSRTIEISCAQVVLCTNAYSPLLEPYFRDKILPRRAQVLATAPLAGTSSLVQVAGYADYGYEYFRQLSSGEFLLGGCRHHFRDEEVGYTDETTEQLQGKLEEFLARYFPEIKSVINHRWSGVMGFSRDGLPLVGELPAKKGVFFAGGFTGHGLGLGLICAERLVDLMLEGEKPGLFEAKRLEI